MTRIFPVSVLLFLMLHVITPGSAQTFNGQGGLPVPPGAPGQTMGITTSIATVSGVGIIGAGCNNIDHITIDFTHTFVGDVALFLIAPTGQVLELSSGNGGAGDNFQITEFRDNTPLFITMGVPPYNGVFRPEGRQTSTTLPFPNTNPLGTYTFANTYNGLNADGDWTLLINDYVNFDVGVLNAWSITFNGGGGPPPTVDLGPDVTICLGEVTELVAEVDPDADFYLWNTGANSPTISVAPVVNTTYMVTVTNNGCMDADTINVVVNPNGVAANAGVDVAVCAGSSTTLNGSGGGAGATYTWSTGQNGQSITVNPGSTTTYTLTVTDGGCMGTDQVTVTVNTAPNANAGMDQTICAGETANLSASGGGAPNTYQWSTGQSGANINVSPLVTTTYTVTITVNGCPDTDMVEVEVNPLPTADAGASVSICTGESTTLSASSSGGGTFQWSTGQAGSDIEVSPLVTTTYTVTVTDANGCEDSDNVTVTVGDIDGSIFGDDEICKGASTVLVGLGGTHYEWSTGESGSNILVTPEATTTYTVTISQGMCEDIVSVVVIVDPLPVLDLTDDVTICEGESVTLTATGGDHYEWTNGATGSSITVNPLVTTSYTVVGYLGLCPLFVTTVVTVVPNVGIDLGPDLVICEGEIIDLTASGANGNETILWSTNESTISISDQPTVTTTYSVTVTNSGGCFDTDDVLVTVNTVPVANAGPNVFIMSGDVTTLTATGGGTYLWSTGETSNVITVNPASTTNYTVTVTLNNCTSTDEVTVFVNQVPAVDLGQDILICEGATATLNAAIPGPFNLQYAWSNGASDSVIQVAPVISTSYSVTVTDFASGFSSTDTIMVNVIPLLTGVPVITGLDTICLTGIETYTTNVIAGATSYFWTVSPGAQILSGQSTTSITVDWGLSGTAQLSLVVSNYCSPLPAEILNVFVEQPASAPLAINGPLDPCQAGTSVYSINDIPGETYQWSLSGSGIITSGQGTKEVTIDWNGSTGGDLCVTASNDCGSSIPYCVTVVTSTTPSLNAGNDITICGLKTNLNATGTGTWSVLSGPSVVQFSNEHSATPSVQVWLPGLFTFKYEYAENGCMASDTMTVEFFSEPWIQEESVECDNLNIAFTVSFEIVFGLPPYLVNGVSITGSTFVSAPILSGNNYSFQVTDAKGCVSTSLSGTWTCNCTSSAGTMDVTRIDACTDATVIAHYLGGSVPDGNDKLAFALHNGHPNGGILAWNSSPEFAFAPPMLPEVTYFISAVVGDEGPGGLPQLLDPCISISPGTPVVFHLPPMADAGADQIFNCDANHLEVHAIPSGNQQNLEYEWTPLAGGSIEGKTDSIIILAKGAGLYALAVLDVLSGCVTFDTTLIEGAFIDIHDLQLVSTLPRCAGECNGNITLSNTVSDWLFDFGNGQFVSSTSFDEACSGSIIVKVKDEFGCVADTTLVISSPLPVQVDLGPDVSIHYGDSISLTAQTFSDVEEFNWFDASACKSCSQINIQPLETGIYEVEITDESGCKAQDDITISVLVNEDFYIPNAFSPNHDQVNDLFFIPENRSVSSVNALDIFDRWGNLVFEIKNFIPGDPSASWDGSFHGLPANPGVYVYQLEAVLKNGKSIVLSGDLTLIR